MLKTCVARVAFRHFGATLWPRAAITLYKSLLGESGFNKQFLYL